MFYWRSHTPRGPPGPEYERAVNENTLAKTNSYRAEQVLKQKQVEALHAVAEAKGRSDSTVQTARRASESTLLKADADAKATEIQGAADSVATKVPVEAAGGIDGYTKVMTAETMKRWNGQPPNTVLGCASSPVPFFDALTLFDPVIRRFQGKNCNAK